MEGCVFVFFRCFCACFFAASGPSMSDPSVSGVKRSRNRSAAQLRARGVQAAGCCDKYVGMAQFASQMGLDANARLRKFMLDNEYMETGELWWKLHENDYHSSKQDVSRFKQKRCFDKVAAQPRGRLLAAPKKVGSASENKSSLDNS